MRVRARLQDCVCVSKGVQVAYGVGAGARAMQIARTCMYIKVYKKRPFCRLCKKKLTVHRTYFVNKLTNFQAQISMYVHLQYQVQN